jgi:hypothetical protein
VVPLLPFEQALGEIAMGDIDHAELEVRLSSIPGAVAPSEHPGKAIRECVVWQLEVTGQKNLQLSKQDQHETSMSIKNWMKT